MIQIFYTSTSSITTNNNFDTDCFELLVSILHGRPLEGLSLITLFFEDCNITNISALDTYYLPNLQRITLKDNNIGMGDGCRILSSVLQKEDTSLIYLGLDNSGIDDEGAEMLAASLKHNTKLESLYLARNNIGIGAIGHLAFLKILVDISSIGNTYNSNHTLKRLTLDYSRQGVSDSIREHIQSAIQINNNYIYSAGRIKVIKYQLKSINRKNLCRLQSNEYCSIGTLLSDVEPTLLPKILSLIGSRHGQREFYRALLQMVPDLMSCVDTSVMIKDEMAKNSAQAAALIQQGITLIQQASEFTAKNEQLSRRLTIRESDDRRRSSLRSTNEEGM